MHDWPVVWVGVRVCGGGKRSASSAPPLAGHQQHRRLLGIISAAACWASPACRDAWGRLQRQPGHREGAGGRGRWGNKAGGAFAVQHPPPFGSAPGTAYRYAFEE